MQNHIVYDIVHYDYGYDYFTGVVLERLIALLVKEISRDCLLNHLKVCNQKKKKNALSRYPCKYKWIILDM